MPGLRAAAAAAVNGGLTAPRALSASAPPEGAGKGPPRSGGAESGGAGWGEQGCVLLPSRGSGGLLASAGRRRLTRLAVPRRDEAAAAGLPGSDGTAKFAAAAAAAPRCARQPRPAAAAAAAAKRYRGAGSEARESGSREARGPRAAGGGA